MRPAQFV